jgi:hypothetical protein
MPERHFPVHPNLEQLRHQAKDLLDAIRRGDAAALADLRAYHPRQVEPAAVRLADAQLVLARSYRLPSWPRLVLACRMTDAICRDEVEMVRELVTRHPALLHEDARGERDPALLTRTFAHEAIYPPALGCHTDHTQALHGTPLDGVTLLHMSIDFDEIAITRWLLEQGMDVDARAAVEADGFGGHTALFGTVVTQPIRLRRDDAVARLPLDHGADPRVRASLRKALRGVEDESLHEYHDVTPWEWGDRFHDQGFVSRPAMRLIASRLT